MTHINPFDPTLTLQIGLNNGTERIYKGLNTPLPFFSL
mgnify:CR=1 FL=1